MIKGELKGSTKILDTLIFYILSLLAHFVKLSHTARLAAYQLDSRISVAKLIDKRQHRESLANLLYTCLLLSLSSFNVASPLSFLRESSKLEEKSGRFKLTGARRIVGSTIGCSFLLFVYRSCIILDLAS